MNRLSKYLDKKKKEKKYSRTKKIIPLYMSNKYKTGDPCPKSGIWLRIEDNEKLPINKDDPFPCYYVKTGKAERGASIYSDEPKRAHYVCISSS